MDTITQPTSSELAALKDRQKATWAAGDYAKVGSTLQIVGETLCEAVDLRAGMRVLDVAGGNGNASLAAARRFAEVTCTDYVPTLLDGARMRAQANGFDIAFREADAEALPFPDECFDVVLSTFGVMFTANQEKAAAELLRVVRPGGKIGMANWTPEGFIGRLFGTIGRHVPPPPVARSPARWGTVAWLQAQYGESAEIRAEPRHFTFRYPSAEHMVKYFRTWYGPVLRAFGALDAAGQAALAEDFTALIGSANRADDGTVVMPSEYLEVVIVRR